MLDLASLEVSVDCFFCGCSLSTSSFCSGWVISLVSDYSTTGGCTCDSNSFPLLSVIAFTCSFPSLRGFTSELLSKEPGCLSVSKLAILPIWAFKLLSCAA